MLTEALRRVCQLQPFYSAANTPEMQERGVLIRQVIPSELRKLKSLLSSALGPFEADFDVDASDGIGRKTEAPWVRFHSKRLSPTPREGYYVVLHFAADGSAMFVTVGCGSTAWSDGTLKPVSDDELSQRTSWARSVIAAQFGGLSPLDDEIALGARAALPRTFERATICAKRVAADEIEEVSIQDLLVTAAERLAAVYAEQVEAEGPAAVPSESIADVCWFVGASFGRQFDQTERFFAEGIWEVDSPSERDQQVVRSMRPGDRIAIKSTYVRKHGLPFDAKGATHSVMAIKATGVITANSGDGHRVEVAWSPLSKPREWYFYVYQPTIWRVTPDKPERDALIRFAFEGEPQDFEFWSRAWRSPEGEATVGTAPEDADEPAPDTDAPLPSYTLDDIVADGCFLPKARLELVLELLERKKNIVLQGPPGTGKTWLARRLGYALIGVRDPTRVTAVQFQPSYAYEDFVLGYRPSSDGRLQLVEGLFMRLVAKARRTTGPVVLVIEEINRGDPAQVFGELLTLLEAGQRGGEGLHLAYGGAGDPPVSVPDNLYVIGTMNLADRSLALVDLALRRRFGFVDLQPELGERWRDMLLALGAPADLPMEIATRISGLNAAIVATRGLGEQFRVGHSYVTPLAAPGPGDPHAWVTWWRSVVRDELGPLLAEYWHEDPDTARRHVDQLIAGL